MTSIIKLQAFSGAMDESPPCYLLQVDEFRFLLDCGWDETFNIDALAEVKKHVSQIDGVLLSYPDLYHLGALPYLVGKCGLNCPIYATIPVYKMGQMFMYDIYQSRHNTEDFNLFNLDDVDSAFDKIIQLKYSQTISLHGKGQGLQITPLPGGHMIGGTIWRILKDGDEELVYAVDYNHKKERHLNGCAMDTILKPTLLITDAYNSMYAQERRRTRDEQLVTNILQTMRAGGNCLIAVDTAGRVLELAHLLDQLWRNPDTGLMTYSLAFLNNVSYNVVEFAKSQMEWMSEKIMRSFEDRRNNPFQFKYVQLCHSLGELAQISEPKVVLASTPDLECGFSRDLFVQWCKNEKNTVILTSRTGPATLSRRLLDNPQRTIAIDIRRRVKLDQHELEEYQRMRQEKEAVEAALKARENAENESSDESDMETDDLPQKHDLMPQISAKPRGGFFKLAKKSYPMYPHHEERLRWDEYGEVIRHSDFIAVADLVGGTTRRDRDRLKDRRGPRGPTERRGGNHYKDDDEEEDHEPAEPEPEPEPEIIAEPQPVPEVPTKCVSSRQTVEVNAKIVFIDFEGRSDGESIKKLLSQIKPKQLIIVHGNKDATEFLADYCRVTPGLVSGAVHTPALNDIVDATTEGFIYQVKLKDSLMTALKFFKAKDLEVAWVDARIAMTLSKADTSAKLESGRTTSDEEDRDKDVIPTLCAINQADAPDHTNVFINEPKLSDLKTVLVKAGLQAEFIAGVLVVNSIVAVKRNEAGKLQIEGCLSEDYYKPASLELAAKRNDYSLHFEVSSCIKELDSNSNVWVEFNKLAAECQSLHLGQGFPDMSPPSHFVEAYTDVLKENYPLSHQYCRSFGIPRLVNALSRLYSPLLGRNLNPMTNILISNGALGAINICTSAFLNPGDECIILEPYFDPYLGSVLLTGAKPRCVRLHRKSSSTLTRSSDWAFDPVELEKAFNDRTKMIIFNNPHNPTGKVFSFEEMEFIAYLCQKHNVICISDEVYEWLCYDNKQHVRMATMPGMWDRTVTVGSAGKTFGITGWRLGWSIAPEHLLRIMGISMMINTYSVHSLAQEALARGLEVEVERFGQENSYLSHLPSIYAPKRDRLVSSLLEAGFRVTVPDSGYFIMADFSGLDSISDLIPESTSESTDFQFAKYLTKKKKLSLIPASAMYHNNPPQNYLRLCFIKSEKTIERAVSIIENLDLK